MCPAVILNLSKSFQRMTEENKNKLPADDERQSAILGSMGCVLVLVIFVFGIGISLVIMYLRSILNGSKEFFLN